MRCVAISCVKNERDIVEAFVRHTVALVDRLIVMDHGSNDGTREILQAMAGEGLPIEIVDDSSAGYHQWFLMNRLMREFALERHQADWIVPLDADEFLVGPPHARFTPEDYGPRTVQALPWKTYVPDPTDDAQRTNPVARIRHRLRQEAVATVKVVIPGKLARLPDAMLAQGSHALLRKSEPLPSRLSTHWRLAHFPGRTPEQYALKVAIKHLQYQSMTKKRSDWGWVYRQPIARLRQGRGHFQASFREMILRYNLPDDFAASLDVIEDPIPYHGGPLRHALEADSLGSLRSLFLCADVLSQHGVDPSSEPNYPLLDAGGNQQLLALREEIDNL